jgi:predicted GIY-YIG superfamily endonuclease
MQQCAAAAAAVAPKKAWLVYALKTSATRRTGNRGGSGGVLTYVGATLDLARRLRQHNGEIKGGAKYTRLGAKGSWAVVFTVQGFREQREALQFEWALKHKVPASGTGAAADGGDMHTVPASGTGAAADGGDTPHRKRKRRRRNPARSGARRAPGKGVAGRVKNLARVLSLPRWTKNSPPSADVRLALSWYDMDCDRPEHFEAELPDYVSEVLAPPSEVAAVAVVDGENKASSNNTT